jgi:hypothetical protein
VKKEPMATIFRSKWNPNRVAAGSLETQPEFRLDPNAEITGFTYAVPTMDESFESVSSKLCAFNDDEKLKPSIKSNESIFLFISSSGILLNIFDGI